MTRKTKDQLAKEAWIAGYERGITDLIDRGAVSWKYTKLTDIATMIKVEAEAQYEVWKEESNASVLQDD
jgi:hypothetical protein